MIRRLFTAASLLSLLVCAAAVVIWVRSFVYADNVYGDVPTNDWQAVRAEYSVVSRRGEFYAFLGVVATPRPLYVDRVRRYVYGRYPPHVGLWGLRSFLGFGYSRRQQKFDWINDYTHVRIKDVVSSHGSGRSIIGMTYQMLIPIWAIVLASGALPFACAMRWRSRRLAARNGYCTHCGYDLRASTDRCPECGTPIPAKGVA